MASYEDLPSGSVRAVVSVGRGKRQARTFPTKLEAQHWASGLEVAKHNGHQVKPVPTRRVTVADFYAGWWPTRRLAKATRGTQEGYWRNYAEPAFGRAAVADVTTAKLDAWVRRMEADGVGPHVIYGSVTVLGALLSAAVAAGILASSPKKGMQPLPARPAPRTRAASPDALAAILAASTGQYRTLWRLAAETGLRWSEYAGLPVWAVDVTDLARATITVHQIKERDHQIREVTKSGERTVDRMVPISSELARALLPLLTGKRESDLVFTTDDGAPLDYHNIRNRVWMPTCRRAGVTLRIHELKHTAATSWLEAGVSQNAVREFMGHADLRTLQRYSHVSDAAFAHARQVRERSAG